MGRVRTQIKSKRMFVTGSTRSDGTDTILTGSYQYMSNSFANTSYLDPDGNNFGSMAGIIYIVNERENVSYGYLYTSTSLRGVGVNLCVVCVSSVSERSEDSAGPPVVLVARSLCLSPKVKLK